MCSKLRSITLETTLTEDAAIGNLVVLLSTLRNPAKLYRIRVFASTVPSNATVEPRRDPPKLSKIARVFKGSRSSNVPTPEPPPRPEVWVRLDDLLCGLCPQQTSKEDGGGLTFQVASRKTTGNAPQVFWSERLVGLLPKFSRVGTCEEVEV